MFAARLARLLSILITSTAAVILPAPLVVPTTVAQESCLAGSDFASMSHDQLAAAVTAAVQGMAPGTPDAQVVASIGSEIGANAGGCSPEQLAAIARNVAAVLEELGIVVDGDLTERLLVAMIAPTPLATQYRNALSAITSVY